jgi:hypothetical protein
VLLEHDAIEKLLKLNSDETPITMGVVYHKRDKNKPMLFKLKDGVDAIGFEDFIKDKTDTEVEYITFNEQHHNTKLGCFTYFEELDGKVHDVHAGGMGCVLIKREVADDIEFKPAQRGFGSEDLYWYHQAVIKGHKMKCDTGLRTWHINKGGVYAFESR